MITACNQHWRFGFSHISKRSSRLMDNRNGIGIATATGESITAHSPEHHFHIGRSATVYFYCTTTWSNVNGLCVNIFIPPQSRLHPQEQDTPPKAHAQRPISSDRPDYLLFLIKFHVSAPTQGPLRSRSPGSPAQSFIAFSVCPKPTATRSVPPSAPAPLRVTILASPQLVPHLLRGPILQVDAKRDACRAAKTG